MEKKPAEADRKATMKDIIAKVGRERAIDMVMQSYNTEILSTHLKRLEDRSPGALGAYKRRDHLADALERVREVCDLA